MQSSLPNRRRSLRVLKGLLGLLLIGAFVPFYFGRPQAPEKPPFNGDPAHEGLPRTIRDATSPYVDDAGKKLAFEFAGLPASGGTIDARNLKGTQYITTDPFVGLTKPVTLLLGDATFNTVPLFLPPNFTLILSKNTVLKAARGYAPNHRVLNIANVENVTIYGNGGTVQMIKADYSSGEQRHAVNITSSTNIQIHEVLAKDSGGDGFYIGASDSTPITPSQNVLLDNVIADNNRRQGLSIVSCKKCDVQNSTFQNTSGTNPAHGVDLEPNFSTDSLENITLRNVTTAKNAGGGILIAPNALAGAPSNPVSITIDGFVSYQDGSAGTYGYGGLTLSGNDPPITTNQQTGFIIAKNILIQEPYAFGVLVQRWASSLPNARFENISVVDPNRNGSGMAHLGLASGQNETAAHSGFVIATLNSLPTSQTAHIDIVDCSALDTRGIPRMTMGIYAISASSTKKADLTIRNPRIKNQTSPENAVGWNYGIGNVVYDRQPVASPNGSSNLAGWIGYLVAPTASGAYTLRSAGDLPGMEISFRNDNDYTLQIMPQGGDRILQSDMKPIADLVLRKTGDYLKLRSLGEASWLVIDQAGQWFPRDSPSHQ